MIKQCLLDLDGVLTDFTKGAALLFGRNPDTADCWDFPEKWGIPATEFWSALGFEFWAGLDPTPEFGLILGAVESRFGKENVCLLSSPCRTPGCMEGKMTWIKKHPPDYSRRYLFGPAKQFAAAPDRLLVDDHGLNCDAFHAAGGEALLIPRAWNRLNGHSVGGQLEKLSLFV